jgi:type IV pilus assembly protein PilM
MISIKQCQSKINSGLVRWREFYKSWQKQQVFGLDVGTSSIKLVQLQKTENGYSVIGAGMVFVENPNDENHRDANYAKAIRQCRQLAQTKGKLAVCGVCGQETAVRHFSFPALLPEEVEGAVELEAKQFCPFNTDEGVIDYQVISGNEKEIQGFLVVAANKILREKNSFVSAASLSNVLMDIDGLALINCMKYCRGDEEGTSAILNIGNEYTTLAIIGDDDLPFVRDINFGGKAVIEQITIENQFPREVVEKVLRGEEKQPEVQDRILVNLETACHKLISNVTETLYYDAVRRKSEIVNRIYLCGGFSLVDGFYDLLKTKLPTETVLWNPFDKIICQQSLDCYDLLRQKGPAFAVAAGLAMRQI